MEDTTPPLDTGWLMNAAGYSGIMGYFKCYKVKSGMDMLYFYMDGLEQAIKKVILYKSLERGII